jgi:hypothetical protein
VSKFFAKKRWYYCKLPWGYHMSLVLWKCYEIKLWLIRYFNNSFIVTFTIAKVNLLFMKKKQKILLVDDEPDILEIVGYNLTQEDIRFSLLLMVKGYS